MKKQSVNHKETFPYDSFTIQHFLLVSMGVLTVGTADETIKLLETQEIATTALSLFAELNTAINGNKKLLAGKFEEVTSSLFLYFFY